MNHPTATARHGCPADGRALATLDGKEVLAGVTLDPFGINVFKVTASGPTQTR